MIQFDDHMLVQPLTIVIQPRLKWTEIWSRVFGTRLGFRPTHGFRVALGSTFGTRRCLGIVAKFGKNAWKTDSQIVMVNVGIDIPYIEGLG